MAQNAYDGWQQPKEHEADRHQIHESVVRMIQIA